MAWIKSNWHLNKRWDYDWKLLSGSITYLIIPLKRKVPSFQVRMLFKKKNTDRIDSRTMMWGYFFTEDDLLLPGNYCFERRHFVDYQDAIKTASIYCNPKHLFLEQQSVLDSPKRKSFCSAQRLICILFDYNMPFLSIPKGILQHPHF